MLGLDSSSAYAQIYRHCRRAGRALGHLSARRRWPIPSSMPVIATITASRRRREIAWAEETVQLKDYGEARQLTLFEHGQVVLQVLTSDFDACPADILAWLKSRWREENFLKYASENYGIDKICVNLQGRHAASTTLPIAGPNR